MGKTWHRLVLVVGLVVGITALWGVWNIQLTSAQAAQTGCFIPLLPSGWQQKNCDDFKPIYPNFSPSPGKCYLSWATGFGPTPLVEVSCSNFPLPGAGIIFPEGNVAGNPPAKQQPNSESNTDTDPIEFSDERDTCRTPDECLGQNSLINFLKVVIRVLSALVGVVVTAMIIIGGIQYTSSSGNPNAAAAAKKRIFNAILALIAYLFLYVILEWLLPGGIFR